MSTTTRSRSNEIPTAAALRQHFEMVAERPFTRVADAVLILAGLYVAASPWIVGFSSRAPLAVVDLIAGTGVALIAFILAADYARSRSMAFVAPVLGVWIVVSPWLVNGADVDASIVWSHAAGGAVTAVAGAALALAATGR
ncbi:SPW repeat protein [Rhodococcoides corynebacterioides]|uniref:SPW repeat protein n=1 Tax=Rhodococcoides corynebacterioides TaxID=53972 RepID=UPI00082CB4BC|nr:SPW repeat protein [Rhodococcus corynebacterioides]